MSNSCLEVGRFGVALWALLAAAQPRYDLLLKGGHVIDPANHVSAVRDVAIAAGKILAVAENIPAASANKTVDVSQFYITPGLVDTPQPRNDHERFARLTAGRSECLG